MNDSEVVDQWRVTGDPGPAFPPYEHTWSGEDAERSAKAFIKQPGFLSSVKDIKLLHRTVTYSPWVSVEDQTPESNDLVRQRLEEIMGRHASIPRDAFCQVCLKPGGQAPADFPCDAYTAAHIGLAALNG